MFSKEDRGFMVAYFETAKSYVEVQFSVDFV